MAFQLQSLISTHHCEALIAMFEAQLIYEDKGVRVTLTPRIAYVITRRFANSYLRGETASVFTLRP